MFEWLKTILILPFNVIVVIPLIILFFTGYHYKPSAGAFFITGMVLLLAGFLLSAWTMVLFNNIGKGTAAPWNPPKNLVIEGPYSYLRNPMITGVLLILISECFLLSAISLIWWVIIFFIINNIYFVLFEEKQLENKFGNLYKEYKKNVPMWIPRLKPWKMSE